MFPLFAVLALGGVPLVYTLSRKLLAREFGSDLLAGLSIVTSVILGEYLVGCVVVLMLSGGEALEQFATRRASSTFDSLAKRMPQTAHRKSGEELKDVSLDEIAVDDELVNFPHEICPPDGVVLQGHGKMNEAYLTGEPFEISKTPGSEVLSGSVNGEAAPTVRAEKLPINSRYARIMQVIFEFCSMRVAHLDVGVISVPFDLTLPGRNGRMFRKGVSDFIQTALLATRTRNSEQAECVRLGQGVECQLHTSLPKSDRPQIGRTCRPPVQCSPTRRLCNLRMVLPV
jgi:hypothetical protein